MQKLFFDTRILDSSARENFSLSEDLMMENASSEMEKFLHEKNSILVLCGGGNNGGDGYALARRLISKSVNVFAAVCLKEKSPMCVLQKSRAKNCGVNFVSVDDLLDENFFNNFIETKKIDAIVDCVFGSGFHGDLPEQILLLIQIINSTNIFKLSCDIPSGLDALGNCTKDFFHADKIVTMGALKIALFSDTAKSAWDENGVKKIHVANLGISRELFENSTKEKIDENYFLLDESDCELPYRKNQNVNKGSFGHAVVVGGEKIGAAVISCSSALRFGAGLVTLVDFENQHSSGEKILLDEDGLVSSSIVPYEIMCSSTLPQNTSALAFGMGLGREANLESIKNILDGNPSLPVVMDADIFYHKEIKSILQKRSDEKSPTVLTPHPKEFSVLLENCGLGKIEVSEIVKNRIDLAKKFCEAFPNVVLLLKGATVLIGQKSNDGFNLFFNPHGSSSLAKAGSGDVLAGLIVGLLAQKYSVLDATKTASLVHALGSKKIKYNFALTPFELLKMF